MCRGASMKLLELTPRLAVVELNGNEMYFTYEEYRIMRTQKFSAWPYHLKLINPQEHSCARCKNRPFDFCHSNRRQQTGPAWWWRDDITVEDMHAAAKKDNSVGTMHCTNRLREYRPCPMGQWSRASPFFENNICKKGEW